MVYWGMDAYWNEFRVHQLPNSDSLLFSNPIYFNPLRTDCAAAVGKVQKNYLPKEEGRGWRKKWAPVGPGLEPWIYHMLGEGQ